jgi:thiol-disulfide isomerase/thioredoxin
MNRLYLLFFIPLFYACSSTDESTNKSSGEQVNDKDQHPIQLTIITGEVLNATEQFATIERVNNVIDRQIDTLGIGELLANNKFNIELEISEPTFTTFKLGKKRIPVFLIPGDSLSISYDATNKEVPNSFGGAAAVYAKFLESHNAFDRPASREINGLYTKSESDFAAGLNDIWKRRNAYLDSAFSAQNLHEKFEQTIRGKIEYSMGLSVLQYPMIYRYNQDKSYQPNSSYYGSFPEIKLQNEALIESRTYVTYAANYVNTEIDIITAKDTAAEMTPDGKLKLAFLLVHKHFDVPQVADVIQSYLLYDHLRFNGATALEELFATYEIQCKNDELKEIVSSTYQKYYTISPGKPAPEFSYPNIDGDTIALSNFAGNLVYIDAWATWCGPCKREIPHLKEMEAHFENDKVEFVSISLDTDKGKWEKMVTEKQLGGTQLYVGAFVGSKIAEDYQIGFIPRFMLINSDGKIISTSAPRPSEGAQEFIEEHLQKL